MVLIAFHKSPFFTSHCRQKMRVEAFTPFGAVFIAEITLKGAISRQSLPTIVVSFADLWECKMKRILLFAVAACALAGCSGTDKPYTDDSIIVPDRDINYFADNLQDVADSFDTSDDRPSVDTPNDKTASPDEIGEEDIRQDEVTTDEITQDEITPDETTQDDGNGDDPECQWEPGPSDYVRKVVVALPFGPEGQQSDRYTVLDLDTDGNLTASEVFFELTRSSYGKVVFTPNGKYGLVPTDQGKLVVFSISDTNEVTVIEKEYVGGFGYASSVIPAGDGSRFYVINSQWRNHGGGIYLISLNCDGSVVDEGLVAPGKIVSNLLFSPQFPGKAFVSAMDLLDSTEGDDAFVLSWGDEPKLLAGTNAFGDDVAQIASGALTMDGRFMLLGDNQVYNDENVPNRVAVVEIGQNSLQRKQVISPINDPVGIVTSPFNNAAIVLSGFGNNVIVLGYNPAATPAFTNNGPVAWGANGKVQLPFATDMITRGALKGLVLIAEVEGIRSLRFNQDGTVSDLGNTRVGTGDMMIPGAMGVQP